MIQIKIEWQREQRKWTTLPISDRRILWAALLLSLLIHMMSWVGTRYAPHTLPSSKESKVKFRDLTAQEKKKLKELSKDAADAKHIIETKQAETAPPVNPTSLGVQDHRTDKETKLAKKMLNSSKALDAGLKSGENKTAASKPKEKPTHAIIPQVMTGPGTLSFSNKEHKPRTNYEKLLPDKSSDVFASPQGGYMDDVNANVAEGDRIDMNTASFRYISYFTGLRKQIEMVWIYPQDAVQRGLQGAVQLEMTIEKDGRVSKARVIESSGYQSLDDNMLKTIRLASPFAPLPK